MFALVTQPKPLSVEKDPFQHPLAVNAVHRLAMRMGVSGPNESWGNWHFSQSVNWLQDRRHEAHHPPIFLLDCLPNYDELQRQFLFAAGVYSNIRERRETANAEELKELAALTKDMDKHWEVLHFALHARQPSQPWLVVRGHLHNLVKKIGWAAFLRGELPSCVPLHLIPYAASAGIDGRPP